MVVTRVRRSLLHQTRILSILILCLMNETRCEERNIPTMFKTQTSFRKISLTIAGSLKRFQMSIEIQSTSGFHHSTITWAVALRSMYGWKNYWLEAHMKAKLLRRQSANNTESQASKKKLKRKNHVWRWMNRETDETWYIQSLASAFFCTTAKRMFSYILLSLAYELVKNFITRCKRQTTKWIDRKKSERLNSNCHHSEFAAICLAAENDSAKLRAKNWLNDLRPRRSRIIDDLNEARNKCRLHGKNC